MRPQIATASTARRRPLKPCASAGCAELLRGETYCPRHQAEYDSRRVDQAKKTNARYNERRSESDKFYGTARWRKLSLYFRKLHPLCANCKAEGRVTPAQVVDHIEPYKLRPDLATEWSNLRALCHACHNRIGARVGRDC